MFRVVFCAFFLLVLGGCSLFGGNKNVQPIDIYISPITLNETVRIEGRDVSGCTIESIMNKAIEDNDHEFGLNAISKLPDDQSVEFSTIVEIKSVDANIFIPAPHLYAYHKPASMLFSVEVQRNGEKIKKISKRINTKVWFGSCDRIERIANAAGVYVVHWSSKVINSANKKLNLTPVGAN